MFSNEPGEASASTMSPGLIPGTARPLMGSDISRFSSAGCSTSPPSGLPARVREDAFPDRDNREEWRALSAASASQEEREDAAPRRGGQGGRGSSSEKRACRSAQSMSSSSKASVIPATGSVTRRLDTEGGWAIRVSNTEVGGASNR